MRRGLLHESQMADTKFKKGQKSGPGRPPGTQNKVTKELKEMILAALDESGGVDYLKRQAEENPGPFMSLIGKVLPMTVQGPGEGGEHKTRVEVVIIDPAA